MALKLRNWNNHSASVPTAHVPPRKMNVGVTTGTFDNPLSSAVNFRLPYPATESASRRAGMPRSWSLLSGTPPHSALHLTESEDAIFNDVRLKGRLGASSSISRLGSLPRMPRRCDSPASYASSLLTSGPSASISMNGSFCSRFSSEEDVSTREELSSQNNRIAALENKIKQIETSLKSPFDACRVARTESTKESTEKDLDQFREEVKKLSLSLQKSNLKIETWQMAFKKECEQSRSLDLLNRSYLDKYRRLKSKARCRLSEQAERMDEERAQAEALRVSFDIQSEELAECRKKLKQAEAEIAKGSPSVRGVVSRLSFVPGLRSTAAALPTGGHDKGPLNNHIAAAPATLSSTAKKMAELRCQISTELAKNQFLVKCLLDVCETTRSGRHADLNAVLGLPSGASSISESDSEDTVASPAVFFGVDTSDTFSCSEDQVFQQLRILLSKTQRINTDLTKLHSFAQDKVSDIAAASVDTCNTQ